MNFFCFSDIPPVYVPVSDRAVFDSTTSERMQIQPDSTVPMDGMNNPKRKFTDKTVFFLVATSPADQQRTAVNSPASVQDNYEAMTPTQTSMNQLQQQQIAVTNFNGKNKEKFALNIRFFNFLIKMFKLHLLLILKHHFGVQYFIMN